jgi:hypothetical protein
MKAWITANLRLRIANRGKVHILNLNPHQKTSKAELTFFFSQNEVPLSDGAVYDILRLINLPR